MSLNLALQPSACPQLNHGRTPTLDSRGADRPLVPSGPKQIFRESPLEPSSGHFMVRKSIQASICFLTPDGPLRLLTRVNYGGVSHLAIQHANMKNNEFRWPWLEHGGNTWKYNGFISKAKPERRTNKVPNRTGG